MSKMSIKFRKLLKRESLFRLPSIPFAEIEKPLGVFEFVDWVLCSKWGFTGTRSFKSRQILQTMTGISNGLQAVGHCPWTVLFMRCAWVITDAFARIHKWSDKDILEMYHGCTMEVRWKHHVYILQASRILFTCATDTPRMPHRCTMDAFESIGAPRMSHVCFTDAARR